MLKPLLTSCILHLLKYIETHATQYFVTKKGGKPKNRENTTTTQPLPDCLALTERAQCDHTYSTNTTQTKETSETNSIAHITQNVFYNINSPASEIAISIAFILNSH
jgi:hypothetical protein